MEHKKDYIKWIRSKVGHEKIFLNVAVAVIFDKEGNILLQHRADKNKWGLPGGTLELGETIEDALKRETYEETGLKVEPTELLGIYSKYTVVYPNGDICQPIGVIFYAKVIGGQLRTSNDSESLDLKYFSKNNLPELAGPDFVEIIDDAFAHRKNLWK